MVTVKKSALTAYSAQALFDLVCDVEAYPQFVPHCIAGVIVERFEGGVVGKLTFEKAGIQQTLMTRNVFETVPASNQSESLVINVDLLDGPFSNLSGQWQFTPLAEQACRIDIRFDFAVKSKFASFFAGGVLEKASEQVVDVFLKRVVQVYGKQ